MDPQTSTLGDARKNDKPVKFADVKEWFAKNVNQKTNLKGSTSCVDPYPHYEYHAYLLCFNNFDSHAYANDRLRIDVCTKSCISPHRITKRM